MVRLLETCLTIGKPAVRQVSENLTIYWVKCGS